MLFGLPVTHGGFLAVNVLLTQVTCALQFRTRTVI